MSVWGMRFGSIETCLVSTGGCRAVREGDGGRGEGSAQSEIECADDADASCSAVAIVLGYGENV